MVAEKCPTLLTVRQFAEKHAAFSEGSLRWLIFKAGSPKSGAVDPRDLEFNQALSRVGRRVLINEQKFFKWVDNNQV